MKPLPAAAAALLLGRLGVLAATIDAGGEALRKEPAEPRKAKPEPTPAPLPMKTNQPCNNDPLRWTRKKEAAKRLRQIQVGRLKAENGVAA